MRFVDYLKAHPKIHHFSTKRGVTNIVDVRKTLRCVPLSVTFENLGLDYFGDESDLLAFYLKTGFSVGDWEEGGMVMNLAPMSKELDPYFVAKADGIAIPKPKRDLSNWWRDILDRLESGRMPAWSEAAYILLSVGRKMQDDFERQVERLGMRVIKGLAPQRHNWIVLRNDSQKHPYAVLGFPYRVDSRKERDEMISGMAGACDAESPVLGLVVVGVNIDGGTHPYDVLVYVPGHAPGAPDDGRLQLSTSATGAAARN